ncbi:Pentachlorophenol 4-monooxygenase [Actinomadura rubteroloni]|uniref:Pentachlorophenol 4-monooxygenase n=1 Tax=Actinomadura rubteroloni TaxID=1926885 RepID=A0A2P4UIU0_9ACTN|nr:FAD-dependent oxidoreductase [Actinomadura rubteroloni]POM24941.1 Pentachlorophenol 4-monooxygenase [Actinomadura rubteroloni]
MTTTDVLIVGAGPTGLITAAALARKGARVRLVDAQPGPQIGSRGKGVQPRTLELLDGFDVARRLLAAGRSRLVIRYVDPDGTAHEHDMTKGVEQTPTTPFARPMVLPQWRLEETLRDLLTTYGVRVEFGTRLTDMRPGGDGVAVELSSGERLRAGWLVGADGGSSTVRKLAGVSFLGVTREEKQMLLGDFRLDGVDRDWWHARRRSGGQRLSLVPLPATDSFVLQAEINESDGDVKPTLATYQALVDDAYGPGTVTLREALWTSRWRYNERMVDRYRVGRVLLAGDAAHVHAPAGAQGMNTGVHDGINLGWKLAAVLNGAPESLLDTYEQERLPMAAAVLGLSKELLTRFSKFEDADLDVMSGLGITYRGGPLSPAWDGAGPHPGDRSPDATCSRPDGRPVRLFELQRGGDWTLYRFGAGPLPEVAGVNAYSIGTDLLDPHAAARSAYQALDDEFVLVRPDGHIGLRTTDATAVTAYLATVS